MINTLSPVGALTIRPASNGPDSSHRTEPVYGGYANGRGDIVLFGKDLAYRVNFKYKSLQQRPQLNEGAQARYDATEPGNPFNYCNKAFHRLHNDQIAEICTSGPFKLSGR
ncbi:MAG TPA: hypothetical protein VGG89_12495 [Candidatus Baltobacteraceae bacterium]|jgi:hypothetical protein